MTEINTNSTVKNFFTNNWLTLVLIVILGVGSYIGIRYMTSLSDKDTQIEQLINTQKATLADKEREITALTASYNAQASAISKLNTKYETDISQLRTELQSQIDIIKRSRVQRVQALASNRSTISTAFAERWCLTP